MTTSSKAPAGWDSIAAEYDEVVTPMAMRFAEEVLGRVNVGPEIRLLDVAAGSGALSIPAARLGAQVVATDIASGLIERLKVRARTEGLSNLDARVMDGQSLDLAPDDSFDVSASQFGVNLFPDLARGVSELARVTKPGGTVLIAAFGDPRQVEFIGFFMGAMKATVPTFAPPDFSDAPPTRLADPEKLRHVLTGAGLTDVAIDTTTWRMQLQSGSDLWDVIMSSNPMGRALVANLTNEQRADVTSVLDGMLRDRADGGPTAVLTTPVNIGTGTK